MPVTAHEFPLRGRTLGDTADSCVPTETDELIAYIRARYHETQRRDLPDLVSRARKVEAVHHTHPEAPIGLAALLSEMADEMERHVTKEDHVLFPALEHNKGGPDVVPFIAQMRLEHLVLRNFIERMEQLTRGFHLPLDACRTWRSLYAGAAVAMAALKDHLSLENNVLFPRFE